MLITSEKKTQQCIYFKVCFSSSKHMYFLFQLMPFNFMSCQQIKRPLIWHKRKQQDNCYGTYCNLAYHVTYTFLYIKSKFAIKSKCINCSFRNKKQALCVLLQHAAALFPPSCSAPVGQQGHAFILGPQINPVFVSNLYLCLRRQRILRVRLWRKNIPTAKEKQAQRLALEMPALGTYRILQCFKFAELP